jgi:hypothetical protein
VAIVCFAALLAIAYVVVLPYLRTRAESAPDEPG